MCSPATPLCQSATPPELPASDGAGEPPILLRWPPAAGGHLSSYKVGQGTLFRVRPDEAKRLLLLMAGSRAELQNIAKGLRLPDEIVPRPRRQAGCADSAEPPKKVKAEITRIIRDTEMTYRLKYEHGFRCVVCGDRLCRRDGHPYAEAHHLRPLGGKHNGPDIMTNAIVLCPNHHAEFDLGAMGIHPQSGRIDHVDAKNRWRGKLPLGDVRYVGKCYLEYHFTHVFRPKGIGL